MLDDGLNQSKVADETVETSDTLSIHTPRSGGVMRAVRALFAGILMATAVPNPAYSATPKKQTDCALAADPERECALRDPMAVLDLIPQYKQKTWAKEYMRAATKSNVQAFLTKASKFEDQPYYKEVVVGAFKWAAQQDPAVVFMFTDLLDTVYVREPKSRDVILLAAAQRLATVDPLWVITHCNDFKAIPGGEKLLSEAATRAPWFVFEEKETVQSCAHSSILYLGASRGDPILALKESDTIFEYDWATEVLFPAMRKHPEIALKHLSNLKYWVFFREYFMEMIRKFPALALKDPDLIIEYTWAKDELFREMKKNPETALENLSKLKGCLWYRDYFRELSALLVKKNPRFLLEHSDQIPEGIHKTMLVDSLKARFGE